MLQLSQIHVSKEYLAEFMLCFCRYRYVNVHTNKYSMFVIFGMQKPTCVAYGYAI